MGACEYCGDNPASLEVMDDDQESGCAMVCYWCHPDQDYALKIAMETAKNMMEF